MSAIFGILKHQGQPVDKADLQRMSQDMSHRGPDDQGFWLQGSTGLGHSMFQTTPESLQEKLPFRDNESGLVITSDARIDNREELAKSLGISQAIKEGFPDSYFILSAYQKWGQQCVNHLLGDFSFAIWNERKQRLFCARDHIGVKPFNYYTDQKTFVFASEAQAITKVASIPHKINEGRIADFLVIELEGIDKTSTFYQEIYRLPPAHTLLVENGKFSTQCYWEPDAEKRIVLASDEDYVSAFTEIYTDAIDKRLRGNRNVAAMLSGGVDSSSIVGIARDLHLSRTGQSFPVFSATSPADKQDCRETCFINSVINQGGLSANSISFDQLATLNEEISRIVQTAQEPFDPMILIIAIYLLAKKSNYRVMLDGVDGDIITSLSPSYPAILLRNGEYRKAFNSMRLQSKNYYAGRFGTANILYQNIRSSYTPPILRKLRAAWRKRGNLRLPDNNLINKAFASEIQLTDRLTRSRAHGNDSLNKSIHALHAKSILHPHLTVALERYDRVAALCGIEPRHPLLDKRVIDFMMAIPWEQKVKEGHSKYLLRKTSESVLNHNVCWRRGWEHLGGDFGRMWLQTNFSDITTTINDRPRYIDRYLNVSKLNGIMSDYAERKASVISGPTSILEENLLEIFQLVSWLKQR